MKIASLTSRQRKLWDKLAGAEWLSSFCLAGGTALALHLNHRESIAFDFFSEREFKVTQLQTELAKLGRLEVLSLAPDTLNAVCSSVKISFFHYPHPTLSPPKPYRGIAVAGPADIAVMKLIAIAQRGSKKDFIDLYAISRSGMNLAAMFDALERKFSSVAYNKMHILKSLSYFADAEQDESPKMIAPYSWSEVKQELRRLSQAYVKGH